MCKYDNLMTISPQLYHVKNGRFLKQKNKHYPFKIILICKILNINTFLT